MIIKNKISSRIVYTSNTKNVVGDSSSRIPAQITAMQGQIIGPPLESIEIASGDCLYLKVERNEAGDGVISGPVSMAGDVVSVSDGTNTAQVTVSNFATVGESLVLIIETTAAGAMRIGVHDGYPYGPWAPFTGGLPALTIESKFALARTVKTEKKPLAAAQISKWVVGEVRNVGNALITDEGAYIVYNE